MKRFVLKRRLRRAQRHAARAGKLVDAPWPDRFCPLSDGRRRRNPAFGLHVLCRTWNERLSMNAIIYLVGLVVVVMFILSLVGLR
jgi:hypothetical protein